METKLDVPADIFLNALVNLSTPLSENICLSLAISGKKTFWNNLLSLIRAFLAFKHERQELMKTIFYNKIFIGVYFDAVWCCIYYVNSRRNVDSKKSEPQIAFEPTTLRDLIGCPSHWATWDSVVSKGQVAGMTGTASRGYTAMYLTHMISLTASRCHIKASHMELTNSITLSH